MKNISILGSTGSIGEQALEVISAHHFNVDALACYSNIALLKKQISTFDPTVVCVYDKAKADELSSQVDIEVLSGMNGLQKIASLDSTDIVLNSLMGSIGVLPTVSAIKSGKNIALANKETLVCAGDIVMDLVSKHEVSLLPVDSEHSAIFQCLQGESKESISSLTLTCSGGPFQNKSLEELKSVSKEDALKHPNWNMGKKITIDSATLMNKGLEAIEAHHLFGLNYSDINVTIHPQSIVHSFVSFIDGSVKAQLGDPDMKLPIQYALSYPKRLKLSSPLNLATLQDLTFSAPDYDRFSCLKLAYTAGVSGGSLPCVLNAANEVAVSKFLSDEIGFLEIPSFVKEQMDAHTLIKNPELDELMEIDEKIKKII